jgi:hypothetical protein
MTTKADETTTTGNNCCVSCLRVLHEILFLLRHDPKNAALKEVKVELTSSSITLAWFRLHLGYTSNRLQGELFFVRRTRCWFPEGLKCEYAKDIFMYKGHNFFFSQVV